MSLKRGSLLISEGSDEGLFTDYLKKYIELSYIFTKVFY